MREYRTRLCHSHGHPEIAYWLNEAFEFDGAWLSSYFETEVASERVFKAGETVQIGWMLVLLKSGSSGDLEVWEPEFDSMPIRWIKSANNTYRHLVLQKSVCEVASCEPDFPSLQQAGLVSPGFLAASRGYLMSREVNPRANHSGARATCQLRGFV